jgi:transcriptional regulator with GAF, ATPase, and Fis domain
MKSLATASELNRLVNRWVEHSAEVDSASLTAFADKLAAIFGVKSDEVAVLAVTGGGKHLMFLVPEKLKAVGSIPMNSTTALVARTARERRPDIMNQFAGSRHASVFEGVPLGRREGELIQKIMSVPIMSGEKVVGVVQISRKGRTQQESGADFGSGDLRTLQGLSATLAQFVELSNKDSSRAS